MTPGTWVAKCVGRAGDYDYFVDVYQVVAAQRDTTETFKRIAENVSEQDARLIAAAPDLLMALRRVMRSFHPLTHHDVDDYNAARAAIAKATGETQ